MQTNKHYLMVYLMVCFLAALPSYVKATTYNFIGEYNCYWNDPNLWSPAGIPGPGDEAIINVPAYTTLTLTTDVTLRSLKILGLGSIGGNALTITENLESRFPLTWSLKLKIDSGANAIIDDSAYSSPFSGILFYEELVVDGTLVTNAPYFSGTKITINGSFTHLQGDLNGDYLINPGGTLTIDSPNKAVKMGSIINNGTFTWQRGNIISYDYPLINNGVWNITTTKDSLLTDGLFYQNPIINKGDINIAANNTHVGIYRAMRNEGSINMAGAGKLSLFSLENLAAINGPTGSTLELSGYYFNTGNVLKSGSSINVSNFETALYTGINMESGVNWNNVNNFEFNDAFIESANALPNNASYFLSGNIAIVQDQTFNGSVTLDRAYFNGTKKIIFNSANTIINDATFDEQNEITFTPNAVVQLRAMKTNNLKNDGIVNWNTTGLMNLGVPGLVNNGTWNMTADSVICYGQNDNQINWFNNGTMNCNGRIASLYCGLDNKGAINVAANATFEFSGDMEQTSLLTGAAGSKLNLYGGYYNGINLRSGATTSGFSTVQIINAKATFFQGTNLTNNGQYLFKDSEVATNIILPPASNYLLTRGTLRLNTIFEPTTVLRLKDADIEGSGNLRIINSLNWNGGTIDVPMRVLENATAIIRENDKRPIVSAPFTNEGDITLNGGIIELNTSLFKNGGNWNVDSDEDVIIDGYTAFLNNGIFSICGNQPIKISFNVPFNNGPSGTFKGQGSYTFNAGLSNDGIIAPGCSPGILTIQDNFNIAKGIDIEVEGDQFGQFDQLIVNGDMTAGGVLNVIVANGTAVNGSIKIIQTTGTFTGTFSQVNMPPNYTIQYQTDGVTLTSDGSVNTLTLDNQSTITINPTLATNEVRLDFKAVNVQAAGMIEIYSIEGQLVRQINPSSNMAIIPVSDLPSGTYVIRMNQLPNWRGRFSKI
jgi:hypothetical protein